jgi:hypothetical protein
MGCFESGTFRAVGPLVSDGTFRECMIDQKTFFLFALVQKYPDIFFYRGIVHHGWSAWSIGAFGCRSIGQGHRWALTLISVISDIRLSLISELQISD